MNIRIAGRKLNSESPDIVAAFEGSTAAEPPMLSVAHDEMVCEKTSTNVAGKKRGMSTPWRLTVKLRGRTTASDRRRGPTISPWTRGAKQITHHGPLQRLLEGT